LSAGHPHTLDYLTQPIEPVIAYSQRDCAKWLPGKDLRQLSPRRRDVTPLLIRVYDYLGFLGFFS